MKKLLYISFAALGLSTAACTKDNEGVKTQIETTLPTIELTSMGLANQVGPFTTKDVIQVSFGGAVTQNDVGSFDFAWYDVPASATGTPVRIDSVHFNTWNAPMSVATDSNSVSTTWTQSSYPSTWAFSGNVVLRLYKLPAGNKSYSLRLYARTNDNKVATVSTTKFITMK